MKTCTKCGEVKDLLDFAKSGKNTGSGYKAYCKLCASSLLKEARIANPEKARLRDRLWAEANRDKIKAKNKKRYNYLTLEQKFCSLIKTAKARKNIECFISVEHLYIAWQRQEGLCAYTKLPLTREAHQLNTVSLDRVDSSKGYTEDNIQLVCVPINRMKLDYPEDQFIFLCSKVTQNSKQIDHPSDLAYNQ